MKHSTTGSVFLKAAFIVLSVFLIAAGGNTQDQKKRSSVPEIRPGILAGYLDRDALPDSLALLPPPSAPGSAAMAKDEEISRNYLKLRGTPRWQLAARDAELMFPGAAATFSCALNAPISENKTPHLYTLLRRTLVDAGLSTYSAKRHYRRKRPFMTNEQPTCSPGEQNHLRGNGSYPSGHTAIGWAWALILSEIAPKRADAILARGRAYGESRIVCNVHWQSDVEAGRLMGAATVARLHADPAFREDLEAAKAEMAAVYAEKLPPTGDCPLEAQALAK